MKSKFFRNATVLISVLTIFFQYDDCRAQYYEVGFSDKVQTSDLIVEGTIIESIPFEVDREVFTCHKLKVHNSIYPTTPPCVDSTLENEPDYCVYIITLGGDYEGVKELWSHSLSLETGDFGFFLLTDTQRPKLYTDVPSYEVYSGRQGFISYGVDEKENFTGTEVFNTYTDPDSQLIQATYDILSLSHSNESYIRDEWILCFLIDNVALDGNDVIFDVSAKAVWGNQFKIKDLTVGLKYDTAFFGANMLTQNNASFSVDSEMSSDGVSLTSSQSSEDEIGINLTKNSPTTGQYISGSYQKLFTATLTLQDMAFQELPYLDLVIGTNPQKITDDENTEISVEEHCIKVVLGDVQNCLVGGQIDEIEPLEVAAGVLQQNSLVFDADTEAGIITIRGCGFDDLDEANLAAEIPNSYRVEFQAAETNARVSPFVSDYILWDDDEIQVRVPSVGYRVVDIFGLTSTPEFGHTAGNGTIKIRKPGLFSNINSDDELTIKFVHFNNFIGENTAEHEAVRIRLKAFDHLADPPNNNGFEFYFTPAFLDNMPDDSDDEAREGLEEWRCRTRVNFEIVDEADIEDLNFGSGRIDYGNVEAGLIADSRIIFEDMNLTDCSGGDPSPDFHPRTLGIIFSNAVSFSADGMPANNEYDVRTIATHEFGHNVILGHVENMEATMFPDHDTGAGGIDHDLDGADVSGGQHVVNVSTEEISCPNNNIPPNFILIPPMIPLGPCVNNAIDLLSEADIAKISPNPNGGNFIVEVADGIINTVEVISTDGRTVFIREGINSSNCNVSVDLPQGVYFVKGSLADGTFFLNKITLTK